MRRLWVVALVAGIIAPAFAGDVTLEAKSSYEEGWVPGSWGHYQCVLHNDTEQAGKLTKVSVRLVLGGEMVAGPWDTKLDVDLPPGKETKWSRACLFPMDVYEKAKPGKVTVIGEMTAIVSGEEHKLPFTFEVAGSQLAEPLKTMKGRCAGLSLQASRFDDWNNCRSVVRWIDQAYAAMHDLTGYTPRDGKVLILKEVPPIPAWAWASDPIELNTRYVDDAVDEAQHGILPFGWVHEMGHVFDMDEYKPWYCWNSALSEWQANWKLCYAIETMEDQSFCMNWGRFTGGSYPPPVQKKRYAVPARQFVDAFFLFWGDRYLAAPERTWDTMNSDEWHSFHQRIQRAYGWEPYKLWYRTFKRFQDAGLERPETAEEQLHLTAAILSHATGVDLAPIFQRWRMPVTQADMEAIAARYPIEKEPNVAPVAAREAAAGGS